MIKPQSINKKDVANMKIKLNPDQEIVNTIREGLKRTGGEDTVPAAGSAQRQPNVCVRSSRIKLQIRASRGLPLYALLQILAGLREESYAVKETGCHR